MVALSNLVSNLVEHLLRAVLGTGNELKIVVNACLGVRMSQGSLIDSFKLKYKPV